MKLKLLLFVLVASIGMARANDTIKSLIITEACLSWMDEAYIEITNMSEEAVQLGDFKIGNIEPWGPEPFTPRYSSMVFQLPEKLLAPGESFLIATVYDFEPTQHAKMLEGFSERRTKEELWEIADVQFHMKESEGNALDSVTEPQRIFQEVVWGRNCIFLEQHFESGDSAVIDQVNGVFDGEGGLNHPFDQRWPGKPGYDIAGVANASYEAYLIRKFAVKEGNLDFASARGVGIDDSEWIAIPKQGGPWRKTLWTMGNHVNAQLNENTLESDIIEVDFANKTLTVPWGIRRNDDIMNYFTQKQGIGWNYHRAANTSIDDSLSFAAKTGDKLEVFVCGDNLQLAMFDIIVKEPAENAKVVIPKLNSDPEGDWRADLQNGILTWPRITQKESGMDTIWGEFGGIPYATRIDSLLDRVEIPSNASWELVTVDGIERPDVKDGDILRIHAEDGSEKDYYISVNQIIPSHNSELSAITWPDIPDPELYSTVYGWQGDTIPNFGSKVFNYKLTVPLDVDGIPGLIAKTADLNASVEVIRASSLSGTAEDRTITFVVTAEDDTTISTYKVELIKEQNPDEVQPFNAEPFISEIVWKEQWANSWMEIYNPGTDAIDLSGYMFINEWSSDPVSAVEASSGPESFSRRYNKYIPGYKYTNNEADWQSDPGILQPDLNVNPILLPGDVFVMADIRQWWTLGYPWYASEAADIDFGKNNPWGENIGEQNSAIGQWGGTIFMFKITNDSITRGLKPPYDINDFELIDIFDIGLAGMTNAYRRNPEIWKGNPLHGDSQDEESDALEWTEYTQSDFEGPGVSWNESHSAVASDVGQHFAIPPTHYMSTVSSVFYKVSGGYSMQESIRGITTGTNVSSFISNLIKKDDNQTLTVHSNADGTVLGMDAMLNLNDTLVVMSADSTNITKYILNVSEEGLNSNAVLTSERYDITIDSEPKSASTVIEDGAGTISGFEYGTQLKTILENVEVPAGANLSIVDGEGAYISLQALNFDTTYVFVTVNTNTYFDVLAEDGKTRIVYQLKPQASESEAIVLSDVYGVDQRDLLIEFVPRGTNVQSFLSNLTPSFQATMKVIDKMGNERLDGIVADDDKLVVTSADGTAQTVYFISKLATKYSPNSTYLAYITSNIYTVDQLDLMVYDVSGTTTISEFYSRIDVAEGATAIVIDENGVEKTTGDIDGTDMVQVTSADGKTVVMYAFGPLTSAKGLDKQGITIYPNPTEGKLNISGLQPGGKIQVFNSTGSMLKDITVRQSIESVSLEEYSSGVYFVVTSDNNIITGKQKVIKF